MQSIHYPICEPDLKKKLRSRKYPVYNLILKVSSLQLLLCPYNCSSHNYILYKSPLLIPNYLKNFYDIARHFPSLKVCKLFVNTASPVSLNAVTCVHVAQNRLPIPAPPLSPSTNMAEY